MLLRTLLALVAPLLALTAFVVVPTAQAAALQDSGPAGEYDITNLDGSPVSDAFEVGADIVKKDDGTGYDVKVWIDKGDGKQFIPGEAGTLTPFSPCCGNDFIYENARGNTGYFYFNSEDGRWESIMISGPNAGAQRAFVPR